MNLVSLDIPDDPEQVGPWLDQHLVGPSFRALVAELTALHRSPANPIRNLTEVLGSHEKDIKERGLATLPSTVLSELLCQPHLLMELQEVVLRDGGPYWERLLADQPEVSSLKTRGRKRLSEIVYGQEPIWYRRPWFVSLATAAAVLMAVSLFVRFTGPGTTEGRPPVVWGWQKPDAQKAQSTAEAYLEGLADAAGEWFQRQPETPVGLSRRLGEFRDGCSTLVFAEHRPLSPEDRRWLVRNCRRWGTRLDELRAALENGQDQSAVRSEADDTARQIIAALRSRADSARQPG